MIRLLIVDDSRTARMALRKALEWDSGIEVVGEASDRREALAMIERLNPDLVTMDVCLPRDDGIEITAAIMQQMPRPILIVTGVSPTDPDLAYRAIEAGALEVWPKPCHGGDPKYAEDRNRLVRLVKALASVPVVRRNRRAARSAPPAASDANRTGDPASVGRGSKRAPERTSFIDNLAPVERHRLVAIGASTGGPPVVRTILQNLPHPFVLPVVIVQHMAVGFTAGFGHWLHEMTGHRVVVVQDRVVSLEPGTVYVAGDDRHVEFPTTKLIAPSDGPERRGHRPSVNVLFESAGARFDAGTVAVLLTGMGDDGADGLLGLRRAGAFTIAQEPSTCAVDAMPSNAIALQAVQMVARPDEIAQALIGRAGRAE